MIVLPRACVRKLSVIQTGMSESELLHFKPLLFPLEERKKVRNITDNANRLSSGNNANSFDVHINTFGVDMFVPPNSFIIMKSLESFNTTDKICGLCTNHSTVGINGLLVEDINIPLNFSGNINIKILNVTSNVVKFNGIFKIGKVIFLTNEREKDVK